MGILSRLIGRRRGPLAADADDEADVQRIPAPAPTPSMKRLEAPPPTPTAKPIAGTSRTAGTRSFGAQGGTPSTQRIHNPTRHGR
jgi:hypothetical protein